MALSRNQVTDGGMYMAQWGFGSPSLFPQKAPPGFLLLSSVMPIQIVMVSLVSVPLFGDVVTIQAIIQEQIYARRLPVHLAKRPRVVEARVPDLVNHLDGVNVVLAPRPGHD